MIGLDTNILISLMVSSDHQHAVATRWFLDVDDRFCLTSINMGEVLRLLTHPRVFEKPMKLKEAVHTLRDFMEEFRIELIEENRDWISDLGALADDLSGLRGNDVFDARIALSLKFNGVKEIATWDLNFKRFNFLKVVVPKGEKS